MLSKKEWERHCFGEKNQRWTFRPVPIDKDCRLVLYGAGYGGLMFLELLRSQGIEPECILDISPQKYGREIMGVPVYSPDIMDLDERIAIICLLKMGEAYQQIKEKLMSMGCQAVFHLYELRGNRTLFKDQPLVISPDLDLIWNHRDSLYSTYIMLEDALSRQTLSAVLRFLWGDLCESIPALPMEDQYFADDIYSLEGNEVFVDCGAHVGEIMLQFFRRTHGQFKNYWAFEPDRSNVQALKEKCPGEFHQKSIIYDLALGNRPDRVQIHNYDGSNSVIHANGETEAVCVELDSFKDILHPTILKIDVEGWESRLLTGAKGIICRDKPVIAIAVYHKEHDLWEIPLQLKQWVPEYCLYIRSYLNVAETVLYAVPPERVEKRRTHHEISHLTWEEKTIQDRSGSK